MRPVTYQLMVQSAKNCIPIPTSISKTMRLMFTKTMNLPVIRIQISRKSRFWVRPNWRTTIRTKTVQYHRVLWRNWKSNPGTIIRGNASTAMYWWLTFTICDSMWYRITNRPVSIAVLIVRKCLTNTQRFSITYGADIDLIWNFGKIF